MSRGVFLFENKAVTLVLHEVSVLAERSSIILDSMPGEMQSNGLLHHAIREFLQGGRHYLHVDVVACFFDTLNGTFKFLSKVELWKHIDPLFLG